MTINSDFFSKQKVLFIRNGCPNCRTYCEFIGMINLRLPLEENIKIINVSRYATLGILDQNLIKIFDKYIDGYPNLFYLGFKLSGSADRIILERFIKTLVYKKFKIKEEDEFELDRDCKKIVSGAFKGGIVCE